MDFSDTDDYIPFYDNDQDDDGPDKSNNKRKREDDKNDGPPAKKFRKIRRPKKKEKKSKDTDDAFEKANEVQKLLSMLKEDIDGESNESENTKEDTTNSSDEDSEYEGILYESKNKDGPLTLNEAITEGIKKEFEMNLFSVYGKSSLLKDSNEPDTFIDEDIINYKIPQNMLRYHNKAKLFL